MTIMKQRRKREIGIFKVPDLNQTDGQLFQFDSTINENFEISCRHISLTLVNFTLNLWHSKIFVRIQMISEIPI